MTAITVITYSIKELFYIASYSVGSSATVNLIDNSARNKSPCKSRMPPNYSSFHPVIFEQLDDHVIHRTALHLGGAAGPSGMDAWGWRRICTSFRAASTDLYCSLA